MPNKHISATMVQADVDRILAAVQAVQEGMPFLIDLNLEERKAMAKFGDKSQSFLDKAAEIARLHPEILPATFDRQTFLDESALLDCLNPIRRSVQILLGKLEDSCYSLGSDAYSSALHVYAYAKTANMITGALEDAMDDLGKRFLRRSPGKSTAPATNTPQEMPSGQHV